MAVLAGPAFAECPATPDISAPMSVLFEQIQNAPNEAAGRVISNQMWAIWATAPDAKAQEMLDRGMARRNVSDLGAAEAAFTQLVDYCPDYAEGYNQRAFVSFLRREFTAALDDLELALARNPQHVAARSGMALSHLALGEVEEGQAALREAVQLNPWLFERSLLIEAPAEDL